MRKRYKILKPGYGLGILLLIALLGGCSRHAVDSETPATVALKMSFTESSLVQNISIFQLIVTAADMDSLIVPLRLQGGFLTGEVEVPAGTRRKFDLRAYEKSGRLIYQGDAVTDVGPGQTITLTVSLSPQVPLIKFTPRYLQVAPYTRFGVDVEIFNFDSLISISFSVYYQNYLVNADSVKMSETLADSIYFFGNYIDSDARRVDVSISQESYYSIEDETGHAELATLYFSSTYPEGTDYAVLTVHLNHIWLGNDDTTFIYTVETDYCTVEVNASENVDSLILFPDAGLEEAIRRTINKPDGAIRYYDVIGIDTLIADSMGISDLTGLSSLINLKYLSLMGNQISDLSPLTNLTTTVQTLLLRYNNITDVTPIAHLTNLRTLNLGYNQIQDISSLSALINLQHLFLDHNMIESISALQNFFHLQLLLLGYNQITDLTPLNGLSGIQYLNLWNNNISDLSPLASLTQVQYLYLNRNQISDLSPLSNLTKLAYLELSSNQITDFSPLTQATYLTHLNLANNTISDISPISDLVYLQQLNLSNNQIVDLTPLADITTLNWLNLSGNTLSNVDALSNLTKIEFLFLDDTYIGSLSPLSNLLNLRYLVARNNFIGDLSPLAELSQLQYLDVSTNSLDSIQPLTPLIQLDMVYLSYNNITDISPLVDNSGIGSGDHVWLYDNPLDSLSLNSYIPTLQKRGVIVHYSGGYAPSHFHTRHDDFPLPGQDYVTPADFLAHTKGFSR